jgi:hypothetical protein
MFCEVFGKRRRLYKWMQQFDLRIGECNDDHRDTLFSPRLRLRDPPTEQFVPGCGLGEIRNGDRDVIKPGDHESSQMRIRGRRKPSGACIRRSFSCFGPRATIRRSRTAAHYRSDFNGVSVRRSGNFPMLRHRRLRPKHRKTYCP